MAGCLCLHTCADSCAVAEAPAHDLDNWAHATQLACGCAPPVANVHSCDGCTYAWIASEGVCEQCVGNSKVIRPSEAPLMEPKAVWCPTETERANDNGGDDGDGGDDVDCSKASLDKYAVACQAPLNAPAICHADCFHSLVACSDQLQHDAGYDTLRGEVERYRQLCSGQVHQGCMRLLGPCSCGAFRFPRPPAARDSVVLCARPPHPPLWLTPGFLAARRATL